ncbi:MAG: IS110 family transposase, partial [Lachnospiraceae bacterium]|nr:IS110 family transposase [Lachnospiraceae bacterium]
MNCNTQNAKIASITEKTLIVGIDVGSEIHYARAFDWRNYEYTKKPLEFSNTEAGFQTLKEWVEDIAEKHGKTAVIPGMEPTGHYWFALGKFLQDSGMGPVHVNPHHVKKSKELDDNNPNKNDRKDSKTIAALVNEGRFSYPYIPTGIYAEIRSLSNLRFQTQEELTRIKNLIARWFAIYFPEYKEVYGDYKAVSGRMVLKEALLPEDIQKLGVEGVNKIWRDAKLRGAGMKRAKTLVSAAEHSVGSKEAPGAARMELKNLLND